MDILMPSLKAVSHAPLSSHGSCEPIDEAPYSTEGAMQLGRGGCIVSPLPMGPPVLLPSAGSPPE